MTLACEDGNSKLVEVVTVVDVDDEKQFTPWSPLIGNACHSLTDSLTRSLLFNKLN